MITDEISSVEGRAKVVDSSYKGPLFTWRMFRSSFEQSEGGFESNILGLLLTWRAVAMTGQGLDIRRVVRVVTQAAGSCHLSLALKRAAVDSTF